MGALWSDEDDKGAAPATPEPPLRAIDLRRKRSYHARTAEAGGGLPSVHASLGVWMREDGPMREKGVERLKHWLRFVLHTDDTPPRAALAFALGVFIAWTPVVGFHTLIALGLAFLLRLNRVAVLAGTFVNNPWTFVPIYSASAYFGSLLLGTEVPRPQFEGISTWSEFGDFLAQFQPWIVPLTTGTLVLGSACALLSFPIVLYGIHWYRALRRAG